MRYTGQYRASAWALFVLIAIATLGCTTGHDVDEEFVMAAKRGDTASVHALLQQGADINAVDRQFGATALMWASHEGHADTVRLLLSSGAPVDAQQELGRTALWYTAQQGQIGTAGILIAAGANVDLAANDGKTPRDIALELGHRDIADLLTKAGAAASK
jgi:ankyrin repeat protein